MIVVELSDGTTRFLPGDADRTPPSIFSEPDSDPRESKQLLAEVRAAAKSIGGEVTHEHRIETHRDTVETPGVSRPTVPRVHRDYLNPGVTTHDLEQWKIVLSSSSVLVAFVTAGGAALLQWMKNRGSRSVRVRHGDVEITINGTDDLRRAVDAVNALQSDRSQAEPEVH